jgi:arginine/ornithine N-succinyltransferase beta subunit
VVAPIDSVRTVAAARETVFGGVCEDGAPALIATGLGADFRLVRGFASSQGNTMRIDRASSDLMGLADDDVIRITLLEANTA